MNKLNVVIVEDERIAAKNLEKLILEIEPGIIVLAVLSSVKQAVDWFTLNHADLIFMDIQLSDGLSFKIFDQVNFSTPVIFTTAYDQFAIKAFKSNGIDYLLKPIDKSELETSLNKYKSLTKNTTDYNLIKNLLSGIKPAPEYKQRFMVQAGNKIKSIPVSDIGYFYFLDKAVFLCTSDKHNYPTEYSLDKLEEIVDPDVFFRINRRMLVSIKSISKISSLSRSRIQLELSPVFSEEVLVSFNKTHLFREWLDK
jgi:two-component system, LytTR family, response regulator LytT